MITYLECGRIPGSKYPRATLDQFAFEDGILYLCKQKIDGTILYLLIVPNELRKDALRLIHDSQEIWGNTNPCSKLRSTFTGLT